MKRDQIIAELTRIQSINPAGMLLPSEIIGAASPIDSVLHSRFEWNDTEAGHRYRLWQARQLIEEVTVTMIGGVNTQSTRVFVSLTSDRAGDGGYRNIESVLLDDRQRNQLLQDALNELERFQKRFGEIQELIQVFTAANAVRQQVERRTRRRKRIEVSPQP